LKTRLYALRKEAMKTFPKDPAAEGQHRLDTALPDDDKPEVKEDDPDYDYGQDYDYPDDLYDYE